MRIQGMEQEVCQLFFAVFCQKKVFDIGKTTRIAALFQFASTKESAFVDAKRL